MVTLCCHKLTSKPVLQHRGGKAQEEFKNWGLQVSWFVVWGKYWGNICTDRLVLEMVLHRSLSNPALLLMSTRKEHRMLGQRGREEWQLFKKLQVVHWKLLFPDVGIFVFACYFVWVFGVGFIFGWALFWFGVFLSTHLKVQAGTQDLHVSFSLTHPH